MKFLSKGGVKITNYGKNGPFHNNIESPRLSSSVLNLSKVRGIMKKNHEVALNVLK